MQERLGSRLAIMIKGEEHPNQHKLLAWFGVWILEVASSMMNTQAYNVIMMFSLCTTNRLDGPGP